MPAASQTTFAAGGTACRESRVFIRAHKPFVMPVSRVRASKAPCPATSTFTCFFVPPGLSILMSAPVRGRDADSQHELRRRACRSFGNHSAPASRLASPLS
jgi:hypothetical protein